MELLEKFNILTDWITLVFVSCIIILTATKFLFPKRFLEFIYLPVTNKYFLVQGKDDLLSHGFNILLFIVQLFSISFFIYLILIEVGYQTRENPWLLYIQICAAYFVFIGFKLFLEKIIGYLFNLEEMVNKYLYQKLTYKNYIGIFILVCNILIIYTFGSSQTILLGILAIILGFNAFSLLLSFKNFRSKIMPHFLYFILYLCALEIAPYIILYKAVT